MEPTVLHDLLQAAIVGIEGPDIEYEFRFRDYTTYTSRKSAVSQRTFRHLQNVYKNIADPVETNSVDTIYGDVRQTQIGAKKSWIEKEQLVRNGIPELNDFNVAFNVSVERPGKKPADLSSPKLIRNKLRTSFQLTHGSLDLTEVTSNGVTNWEAEYEVNPDHIDNPALFDEVMAIVAAIQESPQPVSNKEREIVACQYHTDIGLWDTLLVLNTPFRNNNSDIMDTILYDRHLPGPEDLMHENYLRVLLEKEFAVTDKSDGYHTQLFFTDYSVYYLMPSRIIARLDGSFPELAGTILDAEMIPEENRTIKTNFYFMVFDVLVDRHQDVRTENLHSRLERCKEILATLAGWDVTVTLKQFRFFHTQKDMYAAIGAALDDLKALPYLNDGLIFTPVADPYIANQIKIYKWKPSDKLTIDFLVRDNKLYVYDNPNKVFTLMPFKGDDIYPFQQDELKLDEYEGRVVEFQWRNGEFQPVRIRWDKTKPNSNFVAKRVWALLQNPITADELRYPKPLEAAREHHNLIKRRLFDMIPDRSTILDIGSGRGGDLGKWQPHQFTVFAVEPNEKNLAELHIRLKQRTIPRGNLFNVETIQAGGEDTEKILNKLQKRTVDAITLCFSLTFFFLHLDKLDGLIETISSTLRPGGSVYLLFMDGNVIKKNMRGAKRLQVPIGATNFLLEFRDDMIYIDIPGTIVEAQMEGIVDVDVLKDRFYTRGFQLTKDQFFPTEDLTGIDLFLAKATRLLVFTQTGAVYVSTRTENIYTPKTF